MSNPVVKLTHKGKEIVYAVGNEHCVWRVKSIYTKEPDTISWIESMKPGDIFVDIGANIGLYSMFAGALGLKVYAFEPEADNYALLCKSVAYNDFDVSAYCLALSDCQSIDYLYLSAHLAGGSCHTFGENVGHKLTKREHEIKQGCIAMPLDRIGIRPNSVLHADGSTEDHEVHIKIDVDGLEHKVISGGIGTIRQAKSVLIEINTALPQHMALVDQMQEWGFTHDAEQVERAQRKEGTFAGCGNWIFENTFP